MESIEETINRIQALLETNEAQPYVLFSGGKDSLTTLSLVKDASKRLGKKIVAVHADTTVGLPENLDYVQRICQFLELELVIVRPATDYFTLAKRKGIPRFGARWCCGELKVKPLQGYFRDRDGEKLICDGIRSEESKPRANMPQLSWHKFFKSFVYHPILNWNERDVLNYLQKHCLPINPLYSAGFKRASECWCGVFKSVKEFELLCEFAPDFFAKLVDLEASMRKGGSYLFKNGKRVYLRDMLLAKT